MRLLIVCFVLLLNTTAFAQSNFTLTLTPQELAIVGTALAKGSWAEVDPVIRKIAEQVQLQRTASPTASPTTTPLAPAPPLPTWRNRKK